MPTSFVRNLVTVLRACHGCLGSRGQVEYSPPQPHQDALLTSPLGRATFDSGLTQVSGLLHSHTWGTEAHSLLSEV